MLIILNQRFRVHLLEIYEVNNQVAIHIATNLVFFVKDIESKKIFISFTSLAIAG